MNLDLTETAAAAANPTLSHRTSLARRISENPNTAAATNEHALGLTQRFQKLSVDRRTGFADAAYDTDGGTNARRAHLHHPSPNHNVESLLSPRFASRRLTSKPSHHERDEDYLFSEEGRRSIRVHHRPPPRPARTPLIAQPSIVVTPPTAPLRLIFMRHAERMDVAVGRDWYQRAFASNVYQPFDRNMPSTLPKRRHPEHFLYDVPLTVRGLETAHVTGQALKFHGYLPKICLSSTSLRCVQTAERVLSGMNLREQIPIRIEPALYECGDLNKKAVSCFMKRKEFQEISYNVKMDYKPLVDRLNPHENLEIYFERSEKAMRGILDRYGRAGETVLIVTHAPGILALTEALKGKRPVAETFYQTVKAYPPLAVFMAEYDGNNWRYSEQPYNIVAS